MSFAEIILRVGVTLVAWITIYMHLIMMLIVGIAACPGGDTSPWGVTVFSALLACAAAFATLAGHGVEGVGPVFRILALPLALMVPWAVWLVLPYLGETTINAIGVCDVRLDTGSITTAPGWQRAWAPVQLIVLGIILINGWRGWHR